MDNIINDKKIFYDSFEKMKKAKWKCMIPECDEKCINSHVLQKNGILSQIEFNNHVIEVKPTSIWELENEGIFKYKEIGINEAFTFPGFCSKHDSSIFKQIETINVDFYNYKAQCLFSYRGLCQEIRRKEQILIFLNDLLKKQEIFSVVNIFEIFNDFRDGLSLGIINLKYFKEQLEIDIFNDETNFDFQTFKSPYVEICTSAPINIKEPYEDEPKTTEEYRNKIFNNKIATTFVNIFPNTTESIWIIGEHKLYRSTYISKLKILDYEQALSELLILRMEYWCMSNKFLQKFINPKINEIRELFYKNVLNFEANLETKINLFK
jgi:hypothetical protein